ncbi:MAG: hypothetical protein QOH50_3850 [Kribbellaceae bacterium]|jgi:hypothetical protein|nr:hypothetical protein [Kribbellaceae bacterium]
MKTQVRPLDEDDLAMADLAEVSDWSRVAGPDNYCAIIVPASSASPVPSGRFARD